MGSLLLGLCASVIALTAGSGPVAQAGGAQAQPTPGICAQSGGARNVMIELQSEGQVRSAVLHLPGVAAGHELALLVALHGWGGSGTQFERETGFDSLANRRGFAVLYPSAAGGHWQISGPPTDVTFINALITRVESVACIDPQRVYATGVSNGAGMVARLACEPSVQLAGVVAVAGLYPPIPCEPMRAVSVLEIHGTADSVVPYHDQGYDGGVDALSFAAAWAVRDGCAEHPAVAVYAPHAALYRWHGCEGRTRVEQLTLYGVGHGLPGAAGAYVRAPGRTTVSGIAAVWSFLAPVVLAEPSSLSGSLAPSRLGQTAL